MPMAAYAGGTFSVSHKLHNMSTAFVRRTEAAKRASDDEDAMLAAVLVWQYARTRVSRRDEEGWDEMVKFGKKLWASSVQVVKKVWTAVYEPVVKIAKDAIDWVGDTYAKVRDISVTVSAKKCLGVNYNCQADRTQDMNVEMFSMLAFRSYCVDCSAHISVSIDVMVTLNAALMVVYFANPLGAASLMPVLGAPFSRVEIKTKTVVGVNLVFSAQYGVKSSGKKGDSSDPAFQMMLRNYNTQLDPYSLRTS